MHHDGLLPLDRIFCSAGADQQHDSEEALPALAKSAASHVRVAAEGGSEANGYSKVPRSGTRPDVVSSTISAFHNGYGTANEHCAMRVLASTAIRQSV